MPGRPGTCRAWASDRASQVRATARLTRGTSLAIWTRMKTSWFVLAIGLAAACSDGGDGGGDDGDGAAVDAAPSGLSAAEVACPAQPAATVTTVGFAYSPATVRLAVGDVVAFTMPSSHDAASDDGLFSAGFNATTCVRFDARGTYGYHCSPHRFEGEIIVE